MHPIAYTCSKKSRGLKVYLISIISTVIWIVVWVTFCFLLINHIEKVTLPAGRLALHIL